MQNRRSSRDIPWRGKTEIPGKGGKKGTDSGSGRDECAAFRTTYPPFFFISFGVVSKCYFLFLFLRRRGDSFLFVTYSKAPWMFPNGAKCKLANKVISDLLPVDCRDQVYYPGCKEGCRCFFSFSSSEIPNWVMDWLWKKDLEGIWFSPDFFLFVKKNSE